MTFFVFSSLFFSFENFEMTDISSLYIFRTHFAIHRYYTYTISVIRSCGRTDSVCNERNECCMSSSLYSSFSSGPSGMINSFLHTSLFAKRNKTIIIISSLIQLKICPLQLTWYSHVIPNEVQ